MKINIVLTNPVCLEQNFDAEEIRQFSIRKGYVLCESAKLADEVFVLHCQYDEKHQNVSRFSVEKIRKKKIVHAGCYKNKACHPLLDSIMENDKPILWFPNNEQKKVSQFSKWLVKSFISSYKSIFGILPDWPWLNSIIYKHNTYYSNNTLYIRPVIGCLNKCSYCSINGVRGNHRNVQLKRLKDEIVNFPKEWNKLVILGDDVGSFGLGNGLFFKDLMQVLAPIVKGRPISIENFNPKWWKANEPELSTVFSQTNIQEITIPVQSASKSILEKMLRGYTLNDFKDMVKSIRKSSGVVHISTHLISGFPGETDDDHDQNVKFVKSGLCDSYRIFSYSDRPGTIAFNMSSKVTRSVKNKRYKELNREVIKNNNRQKVKVRKFFSQIAHSYKNKYTSSESFIERITIVESLLENSKYDSSIDLGCGTGDYIPIIENKSQIVYALDISPEMIAQARQNNQNSRAVFINEDIENVALGNIKFDLIIAIGLLEYYENYHILFEKIKELSKGGTELILSFPNACNFKRMLDKIANRPFEYLARKTDLKIRDLIRNKKTMSYTRYGYIKHKEFSVAQISRILSKYGYSPIIFKGYNKRRNNMGFFNSTGIILKAYAN